MMPDFVTIKQIVEEANKHFGSPFNSIAEEIDKRGVFLLRKFCSPHSKSAQAALMCLAALQETHSWAAPEVSSHDPVFREAEGAGDLFGWPKDQLPKFDTQDDSSGWLGKLFCFRWDREIRYDPVPHWISVAKDETIYFEELYTISRMILTNVATTAEIANEIELGGMFAFGSAGRVERFEIGHASGKCENVIEGLTDVYELECKVNDNPSYAILRDPVFSRSGWPHDRLPKFLLRKLGIRNFDSPSDSNILEDEDLDIVNEKISNRDALAFAILVAYLEGTLTGERHPHFSKESGQTQLIDFIDRNKIRYRLRGLGERQFKDVFSVAHKRIPSNVLNQLKIEFRKELGLPPESGSGSGN
jgi:hypothetical protein